MKKGIIIGIIALLLVILVTGAMYTVAENEYACVIRFSEMVQVEAESGLHFKLPFVDSVRYFPKATQIYDIAPSPVTTLDKQTMEVDCYILWSISDPQKFYRTLTGSTAEAQSRLNGITYSVLKNAIGSLNMSDIINMNDGAERNEIYNSIAATVNKDAQAYGITVEDVKIKRFDLPESNLNAVYTRMISERTKIAEEYAAEGDYNASLIRNEVDKDVKTLISNAQAQAALLVAEGEAEYMRLLAAAYDSPEKTEFYEFILALDALKLSLSGDGKTVVLDANSDLAKILMGITE